MKVKLIASILSFMLFTSLPFIFISRIQTEEAPKEDDTNTSGDSDCDSSYPDVCIHPYLQDLNYDDISKKNFEVLSLDPHGFDLEEDGIDCES